MSTSSREPAGVYWDLYRTYVTARYLGPQEGRLWCDAVATQRELVETARGGDVPFANLVSALGLDGPTRDALCLLTTMATAPSTAGWLRAGPPTRAVDDLVREVCPTRQSASSLSGALRAAGLLSAHGLVIHSGSSTDDVGASARLIAILTGRPAGSSSCRPIVATRDASTGCADAHLIQQWVAVAAACRQSLAPLHIVATRGSGRLRVAASLAAWAGRRCLYTVPATRLGGSPEECEALLRLAAFEAARDEAQMVITDVDDLDRAKVQAVCTIASSNRIPLWTSSAIGLKWTGSAATIALPVATAERRAAIWSHEASLNGVDASAEFLHDISPMELGLEEIASLVRLASASSMRSLTASFVRSCAHVYQGGM